MNSKISIIPVERLDHDTEQGLSRLLIRTVEDGASIGFLPPLDKDEAEAYWKEVPGPGVKLYIALEGKEVAGTVQLQLAAKANARHRAEIAKLMVHPDHRRKGIAGLLMDRAEQDAQADGRLLVVLDTRAGDPSNSLYLSRGFIEAGRIPHYARSANGSLDATVFYYKELPL